MEQQGPGTIVGILLEKGIILAANIGEETQKYIGKREENNPRPEADLLIAGWDEERIPKLFAVDATEQTSKRVEKRGITFKAQVRFEDAFLYLVVPPPKA
ncbi:hypothetical protein BVC80_7921g8 [Macleaya cordata]|uniref:Uncharacterized protein n=1 Tax=Macleaya cordata TaxID=56857 RepID=A0A200QC36_MACCD|nr:hypothetical protein BVC80_7921g8 [Macleaya cordata]